MLFRSAGRRLWGGYPLLDRLAGFINRTIIVEASSTLVKVTSLLCKNIPYTAPVKNALSVNPGKGVPVVVLIYSSTL